jgi:hypothetical protein
MMIGVASRIAVAIIVASAILAAPTLGAVRPMAVTTVDTNPDVYATFQSHNQKVISNRYGVFAVYLRDTGGGTKSWRLVRSADGGETFATVYERRHAATHPPAMDTDSEGRIYVAGPGDADGKDAYLWRFDPESNFAAPAISTVVPLGGAQKSAMILDEPRGRVYYVATTCCTPGAGAVERFYAMSSADGTVHASYALTKQGASADAHYPYLCIDPWTGDLYVAWTSARPGEYTYWSIHVIRSRDGGTTWERLDGTPLAVPIVADESGPADRITLDDELHPSTFLSSFAVKDGKIHFVYSASGAYPDPGTPPRRLAATPSTLPRPVANDDTASVALDFGRRQLVSRLKWKGGTWTSGYAIEVSDDGREWKTAVKRTNAARTTDGDERIDRFARYVRLVTTRVDDGTEWSPAVRELWAEGFDRTSTMDRQHYVRYDIATAKRDIDVYPAWGGKTLSVRSLDGFCAADASRSGTPLYCVARSIDNRIAVLVSYDNGGAWHDYAASDVIEAGTPYAIGGARRLTADGSIIGFYTHMSSSGRPDAVRFFTVRTTRQASGEAALTSGSLSVRWIETSSERAAQHPAGLGRRPAAMADR